jgi:hypothetical protein
MGERAGTTEDKKCHGTTILAAILILLYVLHISEGIPYFGNPVYHPELFDMCDIFMKGGVAP